MSSCMSNALVEFKHKKTGNSTSLYTCTVTVYSKLPWHQNLAPKSELQVINCIAVVGANSKEAIMTTKKQKNGIFDYWFENLDSQYCNQKKKNGVIQAPLD